jgi:hypothetical protein
VVHLSRPAGFGGSWAIAYGGTAMFPHHPRGAAAIEKLADGLERQCDELDRLADATRAPAWEDGSGRALVRHHTDRIVSHVHELADSIQAYGDAVAEFDERVDRLNARWVAERDRGFGVPTPSGDGAATPAQVAAADQDHADQVWQARSDVAQALRSEYERAEVDLVVAGWVFDRSRPGGSKA